MTKLKVQDLLRDALGVPLDWNLPNEDISTLRELTAGILPYFIAFTARSGSTFLTHELYSSQVLSRPEEWFNYDNVKEIGRKGPYAFREYLTETLQANRSSDGVFGCEVNWLQLMALCHLVSPQCLFKNSIRWFYLRRRNIVAQAISIFIANKTSFFHSYQRSNSILEKVEGLEYDSEGIKVYIRDFVEQERSFDGWFFENNIVPINIFYEDVIENPAKTVMLFANVLGVALPENFPEACNQNPIQKIGGATNRLFEERFREEEQSFIREQFEIRGQILELAQSI